MQYAAFKSWSANLFGFENPWVKMAGNKSRRRLGPETLPKDKFFWGSSADLHRVARSGLRNSLALAPNQAFFGRCFPVAWFLMRILLYGGEC
jgi:hypothetical protein